MLYLTRVSHHHPKEASVGKRERYEPGTFSWVDLATTDPAAAKTFYGQLFGWQAEDMPVGEGVVYTMFSLAGDTIAGMNELPAEQRSQGIPPHWFNYVSVADAEATTARARELGGTIFAEPFDVFDSGRMAIIQDPTGAAFALWQPRGHIGAGRVNDPGCLTWNELQTRDAEAAIAFYGGLFGWEFERAEQDGKLSYVTIKNAGRANGGIMPMGAEMAGVPPNWMPYFTVPAADAAVGRIRELGGAVVVEPFQIQGGAARIAVVRDPQGAVCSVFEGPVDD